MSQVVLGYLLGRRIHIVQSVTVNPPSREQVWFHMVTTHRSCLAISSRCSGRETFAKSTVLAPPSVQTGKQDLFLRMTHYLQQSLLLTSFPTGRFKGCTCRGQCKKRQCPCLAAGRECDPDLCKQCSATCEGTATPGTECFNMRLRMRQHMRVMMGKSTVQGWCCTLSFEQSRGPNYDRTTPLSSNIGWGAFLHGSAREDDFLGEYTGDLISQEEADRRGRIYDRMNNSYLFNLNEQWVLDARHRGNKFRFANHR